MTIGKYNVIYADPPWRYAQKGLQGAAERHYPTMGIEELCALPVADLAAPDSVLFLWATFPQLPEALRLIKAWGFQYKSVGFVWLKKNKKADSWFYGLGFWTRANAEVCLLATRGHPRRKAPNVHQFFVCTHTDKGHIHNHIYFNSTAFDCSRKFHNFLGSSFALRRLSDRVCLEHDLSVIQNPKQHSKGRFLHYGQWIGDKPPSAQQRVRLAIIAALEKKPADFAAFLRLMEESGFAVKRGRGGVVSFLAPGQNKYTRLRASTLGAGFDPEDIRAVIAGERPLPELPKDAPPPIRQVGLIIDIQQRMAEGKGPAYERWAKVYNLKQMAAALQFLQENNLTDYVRFDLGFFQEHAEGVFKDPPLVYRVYVSRNWGPVKPCGSLQPAPS